MTAPLRPHTGFTVGTSLPSSSFPYTPLQLWLLLVVGGAWHMQLILFS